MGRLISALSLCALLALPAGAAILHVEADGSGDYATIQAAMDAADPSDIVELGDGIFSGPGNRDIDFAWVLTRSASSDPTACRIDGDGMAIGTAMGDGFLTFSNIGFIDCRRFTSYFTGVVSFLGCRFEGCNGIVSLGSPLESDSVALVDCLVTDCQGTLLGSNEVEITRCRFEGNSGVISTTGRMHCSDSEFTGNAGELLMAHYWFMGGAYATYERCLFRENQTENLFGLGQVYITFEECCFLGNAGVVLLQDPFSDQLTIELVSCTLVANAAGAPGSIVLVDYGWSQVSVLRTIFAYEGGSTLFALGINAPIPTLTDCDLYGNAGGDWTGAIADQEGVGCNMSANPAFCDWAGGDLSLYSISPCLPVNNACDVQIGAKGQGCAEPTAAEPAPAGGLRLSAQPNPFNPKTRLVFSLPEAVRVDVAVFDATGRRVAILLDGALRPAGESTVVWDARGISSGIYLVRLEAGGLRQDIKAALLR